MFSLIHLVLILLFISTSSLTNQIFHHYHYHKSIFSKDILSNPNPYFNKYYNQRKQFLLVSLQLQTSDNEIDSFINQPKQIYYDLDSRIKHCRYSNNYESIINYMDNIFFQQNHKTVTLPSPSVFAKAMRYYGEAQELGKAINLLKIMKQFHIDINERHLGILITIAYQLGHWEIAYELYNQANALGIMKTRAIINSMIHILGESQDLQLVLTVINETSNSNISYDVITYTSIIQAFVNCGEVKQVFPYYQDMLDCNIQPNNFAFNALLKAISIMRDYKLIIKVLSESLEHGVIVDATSFNIVIACCIECRQIDIAMRIFNAMDEDNPIAIVKMIHQEIFNTIDDENKILSYHHFHLKSKDSSSLILKGPIFKDKDVYNGMIFALESTNSWEYALRLFYQMMESNNHKCYPDVRTFCAIISICSNAGQYECAWDIFKMMDRLSLLLSFTIRTIDYLSINLIDIPKDRAIYNAIINNFQKYGQLLQTKYQLLSDVTESDNEDVHNISIDSINLLFRAKEAYKEAYDLGILNHWNQTISIPKNIGLVGNIRSITNSNRFNETKAPWEPKIKQKHLKENQFHVLDFHGFPLYVAITALDYAFEEIYLRYNSSEVKSERIQRDLLIVTGKGNHVNSKGTKGILRPAIEQYIRQFITPIGILNMIPDENNSGCLRVTKESIHLWIENKMTNS